MEVYTEDAAENQAAHFSENLDGIHPKRKVGVEIVRSAAEPTSRFFHETRPRRQYVIRNDDETRARRVAQSNVMSRKNKTQRAAILRLLIDARGAWVPLPEIMACAAQYNARIFELREQGFQIENKTEVIDGQRHSWFRLVSSPMQNEPQPPAAEWDERKRITGLPLWDGNL